MIGEGLELMLVGMGVVFSFLILLVVLMRVSGSLLSRLPEPEVASKPSSTGAVGSTSGVRSGEASAKLAVALAAAHRARKGL